MKKSNHVTMKLQTYNQLHHCNWRKTDNLIVFYYMITFCVLHIDISQRWSL